MYQVPHGPYDSTPSHPDARPIIWVHETTGQPWSVSWRGAGGVVSRLRGEGCYADWYCGGHEGTVDEQVLAKLKSMGWQLLADPLPETEGF